MWHGLLLAVSAGVFWYGLFLLSVLSLSLWYMFKTTMEAGEEFLAAKWLHEEFPDLAAERRIKGCRRHFYTIVAIDVACGLICTLVVFYIVFTS
jgi:hypothetical protein